MTFVIPPVVQLQKLWSEVSEEFCNTIRTEATRLLYTKYGLSLERIGNALKRVHYEPVLLLHELQIVDPCKQHEVTKCVMYNLIRDMFKTYPQYRNDGIDDVYTSANTIMRTAGLPFRTSLRILQRANMNDRVAMRHATDPIAVATTLANDRVAAAPYPSAQSTQRSATGSSNTGASAAASSTALFPSDASQQRMTTSSGVPIVRSYGGVDRGRRVGSGGDGADGAGIDTTAGDTTGATKTRSMMPPRSTLYDVALGSAQSRWSFPGTVKRGDIVSYISMNMVTSSRTPRNYVVLGGRWESDTQRRLWMLGNIATGKHEIVLTTPDEDQYLGMSAASATSASIKTNESHILYNVRYDVVLRTAPPSTNLLHTRPIAMRRLCGGGGGGAGAGGPTMTRQSIIAEMAKHEPLLVEYIEKLSIDNLFFNYTSFWSKSACDALEACLAAKMFWIPYHIKYRPPIQRVSGSTGGSPSQPARISIFMNILMYEPEKQLPSTVFLLDAFEHIPYVSPFETFKLLRTIGEMMSANNAHHHHPHHPHQQQTHPGRDERAGTNHNAWTRSIPISRGGTLGIQHPAATTVHAALSTATPTASASPATIRTDPVDLACFVQQLQQLAYNETKRRMFDPHTQAACRKLRDGVRAAFPNGPQIRLWKDQWVAFSNMVAMETQSSGWTTDLFLPVNVQKTCYLSQPRSSLITATQLGGLHDALHSHGGLYIGYNAGKLAVLSKLIYAHRYVASSATNADTSAKMMDVDSDEYDSIGMRFPFSDGNDRRVRQKILSRSSSNSSNGSNSSNDSINSRSSTDHPCVNQVDTSVQDDDFAHMPALETCDGVRSGDDPPNDPDALYTRPMIPRIVVAAKPTNNSAPPSKTVEPFPTNTGGGSSAATGHSTLMRQVQNQLPGLMRCITCTIVLAPESDLVACQHKLRIHSPEPSKIQIVKAIKNGIQVDKWNQFDIIIFSYKTFGSLVGQDVFHHYEWWRVVVYRPDQCVPEFEYLLSHTNASGTHGTGRNDAMTTGGGDDVGGVGGVGGVVGAVSDARHLHITHRWILMDDLRAVFRKPMLFQSILTFLSLTGHLPAWMDAFVSSALHETLHDNQYNMMRSILSKSIIYAHPFLEESKAYRQTHAGAAVEPAQHQREEAEKKRLYTALHAPGATASQQIAARRALQQHERAIQVRAVALAAAAEAHRISMREKRRVYTRYISIHPNREEVELMQRIDAVEIGQSTPLDSTDFTFLMSVYAGCLVRETRQSFQPKPVQPASQVGCQNKYDSCMICHERFIDQLDAGIAILQVDDDKSTATINDAGRRSECIHMFCEPCIRHWFDVSRKSECPLRCPWKVPKPRLRTAWFQGVVERPPLLPVDRFTTVSFRSQATHDREFKTLPPFQYPPQTRIEEIRCGRIELSARVESRFRAVMRILNVLDQRGVFVLVVAQACTLRSLYDFVTSQAPPIDSRNDKDEPAAAAAGGALEHVMTPHRYMLRNLLAHVRIVESMWENAYEAVVNDSSEGRSTLLFMDAHSVPNHCVMPAIRHLVILDSVADAPFYWSTPALTTMRLDSLLARRASTKYPLHVTRFFMDRTLEQRMVEEMLENARSTYDVTAHNNWVDLKLDNLHHSLVRSDSLLDVENCRPPRSLGIAR